LNPNKLNGKIIPIINKDNKKFGKISTVPQIMRVYLNILPVTEEA
jgi:hypothetical protein